MFRIALDSATGVFGMLHPRRSAKCPPPLRLRIRPAFRAGALGEGYRLTLRVQLGYSQLRLDAATQVDGGPEPCSGPPPRQPNLTGLCQDTGARPTTSRGRYRRDRIVRYLPRGLPAYRRLAPIPRRVRKWSPPPVCGSR